MERRRFSEAMMWSVEVGIHRSTDGQSDLDLAGDVSGDPIPVDLLNSSAILDKIRDERRRSKLMQYLDHQEKALTHETFLVVFNGG